MMRHRTLAFAAALALAPAAFAQETDPLCDGLGNILASAENEIPFISLVPATQSLGSLPRLQKNPLGMAEFSSCQLYRAGNAKQGTVGGGPHNYVRCFAFSKFVTQDTPEHATAKTDAADVYDKLQTRAAACLTSTGWSASGGERTRKYEDYETAVVFTREGSANDVIVSLLEDNPSPGARSRSTSWKVDVTVRNPNPNHPKPQP